MGVGDVGMSMINQYAFEIVNNFSSAQKILTTMLNSIRKPFYYSNCFNDTPIFYSSYETRVYTIEKALHEITSVQMNSDQNETVILGNKGDRDIVFNFMKGNCLSKTTANLTNIKYIHIEDYPKVANLCYFLKTNL